MKQPSRGSRQTYIVNFSSNEAWLLEWLQEQPNKSRAIRDAIRFAVISREKLKMRRRLDRQIIERQHRIINHYRIEAGMDRLPDYLEGEEE